MDSINQLDIKIDFKKFETTLLKFLSKVDVDKDVLKKYSASIVQLRTKGVVIDRTWWYGRPRIDGLYLKGRIAIKDFSALADLVQTPGCDFFEGNPIGFPALDALDVTARFNHSGISGMDRSQLG